jgi:hypothetical protein
VLTIFKGDLYFSVSLQQSSRGFQKATQKILVRRYIARAIVGDSRVWKHEENKVEPSEIFSVLVDFGGIYTEQWKTGAVCGQVCEGRFSVWGGGVLLQDMLPGIEKRC